MKLCQSLLLTSILTVLVSSLSWFPTKNVSRFGSRHSMKVASQIHLLNAVSYESDIENIDVFDDNEFSDEVMLSTSFIVEEVDAGQRIDAFLSSKIDNQSRTYFGDLCSDNRVKVDGSIIKKSHKVASGQLVSISLDMLTELIPKPENIKLDILYEDSEMLAISKPPGMVVHPAPGNWNGTFVNALLYHLSESDRESWTNRNDIRPGVVHRLDKGTSGVLLAAKNSIIQKNLSQLFQDRAITKTYLAVCAGNPGKNVTINFPIGRHAVNRQKMVAITDIQPEVKARNAVSYVETLAFDGSLSVISVRIETGRTHQIRVHMQNRRTPVVGDSLYGNRDWNRRLLKRGISRPLLHAQQLKFVHPRTGEKIQISAPLPEDMARIVLSIYPKAADEHPSWFGPLFTSADSLIIDLRAEADNVDSEVAVGEMSDWYT